MTREDFIKLTSISGLALTSFPMLSYKNAGIPEIELIGKGNPKLYGTGYQLREEAHTAFLKMKEAASKSGINIKVVSSYRNYAHQNRIWERKFKRFTANGLKPIDAIKKIIEYSTIPGTSRHHWGTDIDIVDTVSPQPNSLLVAKHFHNNGPFCKLKEWLDSHANSYGFYLVYTDNANRKGFKYEPWHLSYKPLSKKYLNAYKDLDILKMLKEEQLLGSVHFNEEFIKSYILENILDINPKLLT